MGVVSKCDNHMEHCKHKSVYSLAWPGRRQQQVYRWFQVHTECLLCVAYRELHQLPSLRSMVVQKMGIYSCMFEFLFGVCRSPLMALCTT